MPAIAKTPNPEAVASRANPRPTPLRPPGGDRPGVSGCRRSRRQDAFRFGVGAEKAVAAFLHAGEYKIIASRSRLGGYEVDLIAARDDMVAFVEVKGRKNLWDGLGAVTAQKIRHLSRAADQWLGRNEAYANCTIRFDIALVGANGRIEHLENAFEYVEAGDFVA
ncbi:MAG: YraN family protein [Pseudomonadota bacterium]